MFWKIAETTGFIFFVQQEYLFIVIYIHICIYVAADAVHKGQEASQVRFNTVCEISGRPVDVYENSSLSTLNILVF
jgi:hypothetical protein